MKKLLIIFTLFFGPSLQAMEGLAGAVSEKLLLAGIGQGSPDLVTTALSKADPNKHIKIQDLHPGILFKGFGSVKRIQSNPFLALPLCRAVAKKTGKEEELQSKLAIIRTLLKAGARLDYVEEATHASQLGGMNPFHYAAHLGDTKTLAYLIHWHKHHPVYFSVCGIRLWQIDPLQARADGKRPVGWAKSDECKQLLEAAMGEDNG